MSNCPNPRPKGGVPVTQVILCKDKQTRTPVYENDDRAKGMIDR